VWFDGAASGAAWCVRVAVVGFCLGVKGLALLDMTFLLWHVLGTA